MVPDFFISAMIDCLVENSENRDNVVKCLNWLKNKVPELSTQQQNELTQRLSSVMSFDETGELYMVQGAFTKRELDLWVSIYVSALHHQSEREEFQYA